MIRGTMFQHRGLSPVLWLILSGMLVLALAGCGNVLGGPDLRGNLSISVAEITSQGGPSQSALVPASYLFTGTGPGGGTFSMTSNNGTVSIPGLAAGSWLVEVRGLNQDEVVVLSGQALVQVSADSPATLGIVLEPLNGTGTIRVNASWDVAFTVDPSATVSITGSGGDTTTYSLVVGQDGTAERSIDDVPTGLYRVTVQLLDRGYQITGSAEVVRVIHNLTIPVSALFDNLNKAGSPVEINADQFTIGWEPPQNGSTPTHYRVYYRGRGDYNWNHLAEIAAQSQPRFTVTPGVLAYGVYELAVSTVSSGVESSLHTSMADDADPVTGWYVYWSGP